MMKTIGFRRGNHASIILDEMTILYATRTNPEPLGPGQVKDRKSDQQIK